MKLGKKALKSPRRAVIFCGSRHWKDKKAIERGFDKFQPDLVLAGGQKGADTLSLNVCQERNIQFKLFEADWNQFGRAAGPFRNEEMLNHLLALKDQGWKISVVGYPHPEGRGTQNMIFQSLLKNVPSFTYRTVLKFDGMVEGEKAQWQSKRFD